MPADTPGRLRQLADCYGVPHQDLARAVRTTGQHELKRPVPGLLATSEKPADASVAPITGQSAAYRGTNPAL